LQTVQVGRGEQMKIGTMYRINNGPVRMLVPVGNPYYCCKEVTLSDDMVDAIVAFSNQQKDADAIPE
jgi:hypothetical protein